MEGKVDDWATLSHSPFAADVEILVSVNPLMRGRITLPLRAFVHREFPKYPGIESAQVTSPRMNFDKPNYERDLFKVSVFFREVDTPAARVAHRYLRAKYPSKALDYNRVPEVDAFWEWPIAEAAQQAGIRPPASLKDVGDMIFWLNMVGMRWTDLHKK